MFRVLLAASVVALVLIALLAPAKPSAGQLFAPAAMPSYQMVAPAAPQYVVSAPQYVSAPPQYIGAPVQPVVVSRAGSPQMYGNLPAPLMDAANGAPTMLLAGFDADEFLEDFLIFFPLGFVGLVLGYAALEAVKSKVDLPEGSEGVVVVAACLGGAALLVILGNTGVLGAASGAFAKLLLDSWNVFASLLLPGAILKY